MYRARLLGGAFLEADGGPPPRLQRKQLALLSLLASTREDPLSREKLCGYLWPESDPERARHRLADCLYGLRRALGERAVSTDGENVRLHPEVVGVDVWEFEAAVEAGELERAEALYRGPFLDGFYVDGSPAFEKWVDGERDRLRRVYLRTLEGLAEGLAGRGEWKEAARWWARRAEEDPYDSRVAARLMEARARAGDAAGALRRAEAHAELLREELGMDPPGALVELERRLRANGVESAIMVPELRPSPPTEGHPEQPGRETPEERRQPLPPGAASPPKAGAREEGAPLGRRNAVRAALGAIGLVALGAGVYLAAPSLDSRPAATLFSAGVLGERETILLADLEDRTGDPLLAATLTEALRVDLSRSEVVRLVGSGTVAAGLRRMGRSHDAPLTAQVARELAVREGIKAILTGAVGRAGGGYVITARLVLPRTGEILTAVRETAHAPDEVVDAVDRASRRLREGIGEPLRRIRAEPPLQRATTADLVALQKYTEGRRAIAAGDVERGLALLEEAVERDSGFALAWRQIGIQLHNREEERDRMRRALTRAYEHRDRLGEVERYLVAAAYHDIVEGDLYRTITDYENLLEVRPDDGAALNNLSVVYNELRRDGKAAEYAARLVAASDSSHRLAFGNLIRALANQGRRREAMEALERYRALFPDARSLALAARLLGSAPEGYGAADSVLLELERRAAGDLELQAAALAGRARLRAAQGRLREAEELFEHAAALQERRRLPGEALEAALSQAKLELHVRERPAEALRRVETALERWPLSTIPAPDRPYERLASLYALAGRPDLGRRTLEEQAARVDTAARLLTRRMRRSQSRAAVLLAEGRARQAAKLFREADAGGCRHCALPGQARAWEAAGLPDSAAAVYEEYVERPSLDRLAQDAFFLGPIYERLARLHDEAGNLEKARLYYEKFAELWAEADPPLRPRVRAARQRLQETVTTPGPAPALLRAEGGRARERRRRDRRARRGRSEPQKVTSRLAVTVRKLGY